MASRSLLVIVALAALALPSSGQASFPGANGRIVFVSNRDSSTYEVYSARADGTDAVRLTSSNSPVAYFPSWSPDGRRIAFSSTAGGTHLRIAVMNADGSGYVKFFDDPYQYFDDAAPAWSPSGDQIVFASDRAGDGENLWLVRPDGTGLRQLSTDWGFAPSWSPDGTKIAYEGLDPSGQIMIYVMNADGSGAHRLTTASQRETWPSWSPDGTKIVFDRAIPSPNSDSLFVINADGTGERQLTSGFYDSYARWSPDGSELIFERVVANVFQLFVMGADGGTPAPITTGPGANMWPDWGPAPADVTPPSIQIDAPADGGRYGLGQVVTAQYSCTDEAGGSGTASCEGDVPRGGSIDTSSIGTKTFTVTASDAAGNDASRTNTYTVVDQTPPTISISTPTEAAVYTLGAVVQPTFSCADQAGGSGVQLCTDGLAGGALDTSWVGTHLFTVIARDGAGNSQTARRSYSVVWPFSGFFSPVANPPAVNTINAGGWVPLRFGLGGDRGLDVLASGSPTWQEVSCDSGAALGSPSTAAGDLGYNANLDRYTFQWKTDKSWAESCRELSLVLRDGTTHLATFKLTK